MASVEVAHVAWRRSTRCDTSSCVEVANGNAGTRVRNSTDPAGPVLIFSVGAWQALLEKIDRFC
ncbi:hypothetical protein J2S43_005566 [Catenuloplanes nepalensis]|uniref:DUF397 domain-containing protein n=1 Tax=Catenuloplanes nepalensis TaxID=587533 RepID=A0ABT9N038_9ACTN|nr:DUF397 domain-containing protein [Catenuloplanes nepalensis]MDP9797054.1 hypothetical protein [Catenuloplanes nepalensis]